MDIAEFWSRLDGSGVTRSEGAGSVDGQSQRSFEIESRLAIRSARIHIIAISKASIQVGIVNVELADLNPD
jgi:hypothetical protein